MMSVLPAVLILIKCLHLFNAQSLSLGSSLHLSFGGGQAAASIPPPTPVANLDYLIYNKRNSNSRLGMPNDHSVVSYDGKVAVDQVWRLEPYPGMANRWYILNVKYNVHIIDSDGNTFGRKGYENKMIWKLEWHNDGFFYIVNALNGDWLVGPRNGNTFPYDQGPYDDQLWRLVPRYIVKFTTKNIGHIDNRQGSAAVTREMSFTQGVVTTQSFSTTTSRSSFGIGASAAIGAAANAGAFGGGLSASAGAHASAGLKAEFTNTVSTVTSSTQKSWSKTQKTTYTIPAHKNMEFYQHQLSMLSKIPTDAPVMIKTTIKTFESSTNTFSDPEHFVINPT